MEEKPKPSKMNDISALLMPMSSFRKLKLKILYKTR